MEIEYYYHSIGSQALQIAGSPAGRLIVYAEVEDGMSDCGLFFRARDRIIYRDCGFDLQSTIYDFWGASSAQSGNARWSAMTYVLEDGRFDIEFAYPDEFDENEGIHERQPRILEAHFCALPVDYSTP